MYFLIVVLFAAGPDAEKLSHGLVEAARQGDAGLIRALVSAGADPNRADGAGTTPLMAAASTGRTAALAALADTGADLDVRDRLGRTALDLALASGHAEAVRLLRQRGARGSGKSPGDTVCVERWAQNGFCGTIERVESGRLKVKVTRVTGCDKGCAPDHACSEDHEVDPSSLGEHLWVSVACLTRTFPGSGAGR